MASYNGRVVDGALNIRPDPSTNNYGIGQIPSNTEIVVSDCSNNAWFSVVYNNISGYVMRAYVEVTGNVINGNLRLRSGPSTGSTQLDMIPNNTQLQVVYYNSSWYKATYNGQDGYVMAAYIQLVAISGGTSGSGLFTFSNLPVGKSYGIVYEYTGSGYTFITYLVGGDTLSAVEQSKTNDYLQLTAKNNVSQTNRYIKRTAIDVSHSTYSIDTLLGTTSLHNGDTGYSVIYLQHFLNRFVGHGLTSYIGVDGVFGSNTENAVKLVQGHCGITADGIVGAVTRSAIASNLPSNL